jgi:hypothetical protein
MNTVNEAERVCPAVPIRCAAPRLAGARWLTAALIAVLLPKCIACVAAYIALAAGLAVAPELCGATERSDRLPAWLHERFSPVMVWAMPFQPSGDNMSEVRPVIR